MPISEGQHQGDQIDPPCPCGGSVRIAELEDELDHVKEDLAILLRAALKVCRGNRAKRNHARASRAEIDLAVKVRLLCKLENL